MKYIILAAGKGTRLNPLTNIQPKCLFKLDEDKTVIERMVIQIKNNDSKAEIIIVTGFMYEKIKVTLSKYDIKIIYNPFYEVTNSIGSLWFAGNELFKDTIILNGDIVISDKLANKIFSQKIDCTKVLLDSSIKISGDYNVQINEDKVLVMSKELTEYYGEYAGITLISGKDIEIFRHEIDDMVNHGFYNQWYENALVQLIFNNNFELQFMDIAEYEWTEIDNVNDLVNAKKISTVLRTPKE